MEMEYDVFISYSRQNMGLADKIELSLKGLGLRCFIDREDIEIGEDFAEKISKSIFNSEVLLLIWTSDSNQSQNVAKEVGLATTYKKSIIPFKVGNFTPHYRLAYHLVSASWADENQGFSEKEIDKFVLKVLKAVENARKKRVEKEEYKTDETKVSSLNEIKKQEQEKLEIFKPKIQEEKENFLSHPLLDARISIAYSFEKEYALGCDMFRCYKLDEAFDLLLEPALSDYKQARQILHYCVDSQIRCCKIKEHRFEDLMNRIDFFENGFALYIVGKYFLNVKNNYKEAYQYAVKSMNLGSDYGKILYIRCYEFGFGVEKNFDKVLPLLRKLAIEGNPIAKYIYGRNLLYGWSCEKQPELGLKLITEGANMGDIMCLKELALASKEPDKIEEIYKHLIDIGWVEAYASLGYMFAFTEEVSKKDIKKAFLYFQQGAELNEAGCMESLGVLYENGLNGKANIKLAIKWYEKAAELGSRFAYYYLGDIYYYGRDNVDVDTKKAWDYFKEGAERYRSWDSYYMMARIFYDGDAPQEIVEQDAVKYYEECVFGGGSYASDAACQLYDIYHEGKGVVQDEEKGIYYLQQAANYGQEGALLKLGKVLTADIESPYSDEIKGIKYLTQAYEMGNVEAAILLAELYRKGLATIRDIDKSKEFLQFAIDKEDNARALCEMGKLFAHVEQVGWDEKFEDENLTVEQKRIEQKIAIEYLTRAADKGCLEAYSCLVSIGCDCIFADDISDNDAEKFRSKMFEWAKKGADQDYHQSYLDLGVLYQLGVGTDANIYNAEKYYKRACVLGSKIAPSSLALLYDECYHHFRHNMSDAYFYTFLSQFRRGYEIGNIKKFDEHCVERARELEKSENGFDPIDFADWVLPRKLTITSSSSLLLCDCISNSRVRDIILSLKDVYLEAQDFLSYGKFISFSDEYNVIAFIDDIRLYESFLWRKLRFECDKLILLSFFDQKDILDIAEVEKNQVLKCAIISLVKISLYLDALYIALNDSEWGMKNIENNYSMLLQSCDENKLDVQNDIIKMPNKNVGDFQRYKESFDYISQEAYVNIDDELLINVARMVVLEQFCSVSQIQVKMEVGHIKALKVVSKLEKLGIVRPSKEFKNGYDVLVEDIDKLESIFFNRVNNLE